MRSNRTWSITPNDETKDYVKDFMERRKIKTRTKAFEKIIEEHAEFTQKSEQLKEKEIYLNDCLSGKSEQEIYNKAMSLDYPNDCYDMLTVEGKPIQRECVCPPSLRPVHVPRDKKTGKYIVDNPRICRRCKALGYRKVKEKRKSNKYNATKSNNRFRKERDPFEGYPRVNWNP